MTNEPIEVTVTNRGDAAATGPGLVLGTIGLIFGFALLAMVVVVVGAFLVLVVPAAAILWVLSRLGRLNARYLMYLDEMGLEDRAWEKR